MVKKNKIYRKGTSDTTIKESKREKTSKKERKKEGRRKKAHKRTKKKRKNEAKQMMLSVFVSLKQAYPCN